VSRCPPFIVLPLLLQLAGGLQHVPIIFAPFAFASETYFPARVPSEFMPMRRMDKPIASVPVVLKSLSTGMVLLLGIKAVLMPNP